LTTGAPEAAFESEGGGAFSGGVGGAAPVGEIAARSPWQLFWRRLKNDKVAMGALIVVIALILIAIFAPLIIKLVGAPPYDQFDQKALDEFGQPSGPSSAHIWGIDNHGGDVFSRTLTGAQVSLKVAIVATGVSLIIGIVVGLFAGFYRGWVDTVLSRTMDILLAFPILLLALGIGSACSDPKEGCLGGALKPGQGLVIAVIAFANWPYIARLVRGQVLSLREKEFVEAARSLGASGPRIVFREILPNLVAPIIVYASLVIPQNVLFEASLSFLGVGVRFPEPSWGDMLADAAPIFYNAWWFMLFPGLALLITVLAFNLVGDGLQDALNPRSGR
jgi:peptide/nickel transport system permease protein